MENNAADPVFNFDPVNFPVIVLFMFSRDFMLFGFVIIDMILKLRQKNVIYNENSAEKVYICTKTPPSLCNRY